MDYREHLFRPLSLGFVDQLVEVIFSNPDDFEIIYTLIFDPEDKIAWRAAWVCQKVSEKFPGWFTEKQFLELADLAITTSHSGIKRGCLSVIYNLPLPDSIPVDFLNSCFEWMISARSPIAVQALSMKILDKICMKEPDLINEFRTYLESISPEDYSKGFNAARNKILKKLINKQL